MELPSFNALEKTSLSESSSTTHDEAQSLVENVLQQSILAHNRMSPWFQLPTELWFRILPLLTSEDQRHFSYVCKRFYLLAQDQACRHRVNIRQKTKLELIWFEAIKRRKPVSLAFIECRQEDLEQIDPVNQQL
jgi:hypothetical protein